MPRYVKGEVYMRIMSYRLPEEANIKIEAGEALVKLWGTIGDVLGESWPTAWLRSKNNSLLLVTAWT